MTGAMKKSKLRQYRVRLNLPGSRLEKGVNLQMDLIKEVEKQYLKEDIPKFSPGDTVRVHVKVVEGTRERTQVFEGVVIRRQGSGLKETFTVRRVTYGIGVERIFPVHSPVISRIEVVKRGKVRRAKLYYLRKRTGKAARIKERI